MTSPASSLPPTRCSPRTLWTMFSGIARLSFELPLLLAVTTLAHQVLVKFAARRRERHPVRTASPGRGGATWRHAGTGPAVGCLHAHTLIRYPGSWAHLTSSWSGK